VRLDCPTPADGLYSKLRCSLSTYFFKANHGSAMNIKVVVPCSDEEMEHIKSEGKRWLDTDYGLKTCQW
jgi:hypothetical protein